MLCHAVSNTDGHFQCWLSVDVNGDHVDGTCNKIYIGDEADCRQRCEASKEYKEPAERHGVAPPAPKPPDMP
jgi:hypothetical protein